MSKHIIRVVETNVYEYSPIDEDGKLEDWYNEDGRSASTIQEAMAIDRKALADIGSDDWVPLSDFATLKAPQTVRTFLIVEVPDNYDPTNPDSLPKSEKI